MCHNEMPLAITVIPSLVMLSTGQPWTKSQNISIKSEDGCQIPNYP